MTNGSGYISLFLCFLGSGNFVKSLKQFLGEFGNLNTNTLDSGGRSCGYLNQCLTQLWVFEIGIGLQERLLFHG